MADDDNSIEEEWQVREGYIGGDYTGDSCPKCERLRMMECSNGKVLCEKCGWEPAKNDYNYTYLEISR